MANTAFAAFTIGKDMALAIELVNVLGGVVPAGTTGVVLDVSDIGYLQNFQASPQHSTIEAKPISHGGVKKFRDKFEHWEGGFEIIRTGLEPEEVGRRSSDQFRVSAPSGDAVADIATAAQA